jgi:hypothetical protein
MRKYLLGAAALLAIAAPGVASAQSGYIDLGYQSSEADLGGTDVEGDGWTLGGATAWGGDGSLGVQLDGLVSSAEGDSGGDSTTWTVGGHLFSRSSGGLIGGFANFGNVDIDGGGDFDVWTVGLEGQLYMARTTIDGAVSYSEAEDLDAEMTAVDAGLTHFFTDNFSAGGAVGFGSIETGLGDGDATTFGLNAEWQFATAPISIFGGWQHVEIDDIDADADTLGIGVRYNWGGTLFDRNRSGAGLARGGGLGRFGGLL